MSEKLDKIGECYTIENEKTEYRDRRGPPPAVVLIQLNIISLNLIFIMCTIFSPKNSKICHNQYVITFL